MRPFTVTADCVGCGACLATCPERAFRVVRATPPLVVLGDVCTGCGECAEVCPADACVEREDVDALCLPPAAGGSKPEPAAVSTAGPAAATSTAEEGEA